MFTTVLHLNIKTWDYIFDLKYGFALNSVSLIPTAIRNRINLKDRY